MMEEVVKTAELTLDALCGFGGYIFQLGFLGEIGRR
jgi:hypothetical protein